MLILKKILLPKNFIFYISLIIGINFYGQNTKSISGIVLSNGEPLPSASVIVKGTKIGMATDFDGKFSLEIPEKAEYLEVSYIGYITQEVKIIGKEITVELIEEANTLSEVIVTALGIKREEKALGYAVQSVKGDNLQTVKGLDVGTSLTGKVAGVLIKNSSEFAELPSIQVRGENPLIIIDGVAYGNLTLRDVATDDIEKIDVLKGDTASALYGARGASGVIVITTKKGTNTAGFSIGINSSSMFSAGYLAIPEMQSVYGRAINANNQVAAAGDGSWGVPLDGRMVKQWNPISKSYELLPYLPLGKDNFRNFIGQGYILNHNLSISNNTEKNSVRTSISWIQNQGQYPNSVFNKLSYSLNGSINLGKLKLSSGFGYNRQNSPNIGFSGYTGYDPMYNLLVWSSPDYNVLDYQDYWLVVNESQNNSYIDTNNNPYFDRWEKIHSVKKDVINAMLFVDYEFTDWLKASFRTGVDNYYDNQTVRISKGSLKGAGSATVLNGGDQIWDDSLLGSYNVGLGKGYSINNDLIFNSKLEFGDFDFNSMLGGSIYYIQNEGIESMTQGGLTIPGYYSLNASTEPVKTNAIIVRKQTNSVFGNLGVAWKNSVFVEGTLRNDWDSTLPSSTRSYLYPSVSGSIILSEFLPKTDWLSFWKIRGNWTETKKAFSPYSINETYGITPNAWGSLTSATLSGIIFGEDVRPETTTSFEVGTALNLFRNRATLDLSFYNKKRFDFIVNTDVNPSSGYYSKLINLKEEHTRKGVEISSNLKPIKTENWDLEFGLNWSKYAQFYTKLDPDYSIDRPWIKVGERTDHWAIYDYLRDSEGNIIHSAGLPQFSDFYTKFGNADPDWIWGINSSLRYKNIKFNISFDGRVGGLAETTTEMYMWISGNHPNSLVPERYLDVTQSGGHYIGNGVKIISGTVTYDTYGNITSDTRVFAPNDVPVTYQAYIEDYHSGTAWGGSPAPIDLYSTTFFKIREIALNYSFNSNLKEKIKAKEASISLIGQNVFLWAKQFKYSDPDGGFENFSDPSIRYIGMNLKLDF